MNQSDHPFFSIITVTYNAEKYLEATLESIVRQDFRDFELIVVDGQSTDGTAAIIDRYREHIDTLVVEKDRGIYDAMNKGIERATGKYVNFMNASDRFYAPQTLRTGVPSTDDGGVAGGHRLRQGDQHQLRAVAVSVRAGQALV